ncbi:hypothetical protein Tsubulata_044608 [Turnera subulata]|uniref:Sphingomyelin synthase-like domain-containing protein n=1 Tax=Turnera subulata TaxID=218843 RepID=A0A9Q0JRN2_9ROSI|nr:hypothetical protein Tsubulata_044608 [Turnera subulata]
MPLYVDRQAPKLWRKICAETFIESALVAENWKPLLGGIFFQELGRDKAYVSETLFAFIFASFALVRFDKAKVAVGTMHMEMGTNFQLLLQLFRGIKHFAWLLAVVQSFLILASRKHYTVDVVVAWYTVNLVAFFIDKQLPELPDRSAGVASAPLLPLSRDKDSKNKEEQKLLIGASSVETTN